jgi:large subunit ribosomal protein L32
MPVPKRRTSKSRIRTRRHSHRHNISAVQKCSNCGAPQQSHRVCPACGYYGGKQVITIEAE